MHRTTDRAKVFVLLHQLGIASNYKGYIQAADAACLAAQYPKKLSLVTKQLYPEVAKKYRTTWSAVERNIRSVIDMAWENKSKLLEEMAGQPLKARPETRQFISILARAIKKDVS